MKTKRYCFWLSFERHGSWGWGKSTISVYIRNSGVKRQIIYAERKAFQLANKAYSPFYVKTRPFCNLFSSYAIRASVDYAKYTRGVQHVVLSFKDAERMYIRRHNSLSSSKSKENFQSFYSSQRKNIPSLLFVWLINFWLAVWSFFI